MISPQISSFAQTISNWSDFVSLGLLFTTVHANGIEPKYSLRGFSWHQHVIQLTTLASLVSFSAFRYFFEGTTSSTAHREFLTISVLYFMKWIYDYYVLHWPSNKPCRFALVASEVSNLKSLRVGSSSFPSRRGEKEVVLRKGTSKATGTPYWRGAIEKEEKIGNVWIVHLSDENMHNDSLSQITTISYAREHNDSMDDLYRRLYQTVMTVEGADDSIVDWTYFLERYSAIEKTKFAMRTGATGESALAGVARRIAADACNYVSGKGEFRTALQIQLMNLCIEKAADQVVRDLGRQEVE